VSIRLIETREGDIDRD